MKTTPKIILLLAVIGLLLAGGWASACFAETKPAKEPVGEQSGAAVKKKHASGSKSLLDLYSEGGPIMHFIALCSMSSIALAIYCGMSLRRDKFMPSALVTQLNQLMTQRDVAGAFHLCQQHSSPLTGALASALVKANFERDMFNKTSMENAISDYIFHEETKKMVIINYLNVLAVLAPMIGLLGTTSGMINSFGALTAGRAEATDLAGGIGEALVATAGGLFLAIPSMFLYFFFRGQLQSLLADVHKTLAVMLDLFTGEVTISTLSHPTGLTGKVPVVKQ